MSHLLAVIRCGIRAGVWLGLTGHTPTPRHTSTCPLHNPEDQ